MGPKDQTQAKKPWPPEGTMTKEMGQKAMKQIAEYYVPEHGSLPAPHQPAARSSWPQSMADVPGESRSGQHMPFPARRVEANKKPAKKLPVQSPYEGIWQTEGKRK